MGIVIPRTKWDERLSQSAEDEGISHGTLHKISSPTVHRRPLEIFFLLVVRAWVVLTVTILSFWAIFELGMLVSPLLIR